MAIKQVVFASLIAAAGAVQAQGIITSGSTYFQLVGTPFSTGSGNANLLFGSSSAFATDQVFRYGWSYNQGVGTSNRPFSTLDTPVQSYVGNVATLSWTNAGAGPTGFARWNAVMTITLTEIAPTPGGSVPGQARVDTLLSFTANAANSGAIAFSIYHDLDLDIIGSSGTGGDTYHVLDASAGSGISGRASDSSSSNFAEFSAVGAQRYQFATGSTLRTSVGAVSGTGSGDLGFAAGTVQSDWASTDGAVAFEWTRTLAPGASTAFSSSFTINTPLPVPVPEPGPLTLWALGLPLLAAAGRRFRR